MLFPSESVTFFHQDGKGVFRYAMGHKLSARCVIGHKLAA